MSDHEAPQHPERPEPVEAAAAEGETAAPTLRIDQPWRRAEAWARVIDGSIEDTRLNGQEIDLGTARSIAHVLGVAVGRDSHLAAFGRTAEGTYEQLRDEYLPLYADPTTPPEVKEWINWLGTYLVQRENIGSGRRFMNPHGTPDLTRLLVRTALDIGGMACTVHLPASLDSGDIDALAEDLALLSIDQDEALQAFLTLPDVDASTPMLMESFHETYLGSYADLDALGYDLLELQDRETEIYNYATDQGFFIEGLRPNEDWLLDQARELYDVVEMKERIHVFAK